MVREMGREVWLFLGAMSVISLLIVGIHAAITSWTAPAVVVVKEAGVGVYSDSACTTPITTVDFGTVTRGAQTLKILLYIKNEGTGTVKVYWKSTLSSVINKITDSWVGYNNGTTLSSGSKITVEYRINIAADISVGTYEWTLTIWPE